MYRLAGAPSLLERLRAIGVGPGEIDVVVNTHLHFDHAGGNTRAQDGDVVPTFPRARYVVQHGEWEDALHPHERSRASYREDDFLPLAETGQLQLVDGEAEIAPGVRVVPTGGHTRHHQAVVVEDHGLVVASDLLPTTRHVRLPWLMSFDLYPEAVLEAKRRLLADAALRGTALLFYHDAERPLGRVRASGDGYVVDEVAA